MEAYEAASAASSAANSPLVVNVKAARVGAATWPGCGALPESGCNRSNPATASKAVAIKGIGNESVRVGA